MQVQPYQNPYDAFVNAAVSELKKVGVNLAKDAGRYAWESGKRKFRDYLRGEKKPTEMKSKRPKTNSSSRKSFRFVRPKSTKSTLAVGPYRKTAFRRKKVNKFKRRARARFYRKVQNVIESDTPSGHYIRKTPAVCTATQSGLCGFTQLACCTTGDFILGVNKVHGDIAADDRKWLRSKVYLENVVNEIQFKNNTNACVNVDEYVIVNRNKTTNQSFASPRDWLNAYFASNIVEGGQLGASGVVPSAAGNQGGLATVSSNAADGLQSGTTLFHYPQFFQYYRILKKTRYLLQPGQCVSRQRRKSRNKTINLEQMTLPPTGVNATAPALTPYATNKHTYWYLYLAWGEPVADDFVSTSINTGPCKIDFIHTIDYKFRVVPKPPVQNQQSTFVLNELKVITTPSLVNENGATIQTYNTN